MSDKPSTISIGDVMAARRALHGYIYETPVINSNALARKTGHQRVLLKCENLQRTGSYHLRGHMYKVIRTTEREMDVDSFVTFSTANGGAALSCAATEFQKTAHVVIPEHLADSITRSIKHYGGDYVEVKPTPQGRAEAVTALLEKYNRTEGKVHHKAVFVHPYTDRRVITGYGTVGVEMMLQTDCQIDCVLTPVGGGSLLTGLAIAVKAMKPNVAIFGCEPTPMTIYDEHTYFKRGDDATTAAAGPGPDTQKGPDQTKSKEEEAGQSARIPQEQRVMKGGEVDRFLAQRHQCAPPGLVNGIVRVSDEEIRYAFRFIYERCKLVVDTKAAMAVAALLARPDDLEKFKCVAIVLTGGNVNLNQVPKIAVARL